MNKKVIFTAQKYKSYPKATKILLTNYSCNDILNFKVRKPQRASGLTLPFLFKTVYKQERERKLWKT